MATIDVQFESRHPPLVREHLTRFFQTELTQEPGSVTIVVRGDPRGWRIVRVSPPEHLANLRKALYRAGGGYPD